MSRAARDASLARVLQQLDPIDLDTLTQHAALLTRVDRKYLVPHADAAELLARLPGDARVLEIDGRRAFGYRSVYFDTPTLQSYSQASRRRRHRFKVRTRTYLDSGTCWLEAKTRGPRGTTVKQRQPHHPARAHELGPEGEQFLRAVLPESALPADAIAQLSPVLETRYRRATLHLPQAGARVTLDTDLRWTDQHRLTTTRSGLVVIETKAGATPSPVDRILWRHGHRPASISKYGTGLAALDPDLPSHRWRRTLSRLSAAC